MDTGRWIIQGIPVYTANISAGMRMFKGGHQ
jgi:hypothetical protein